MAQHRRLLRAWEAFDAPGDFGKLARETGFVKRLRKLTGRRFFWALVLGALQAGTRSFPGLARFFTSVTGVSVSKSSLQERFTPEAVEFMRRAFQRTLRRVWGRVRTELKGKLARFKDVVAIDSTVVRLRDFLAERFPACRTNQTQAALKMHTVASLSRQQVERLRITAERVHDRKGIPSGLDVAGRLLFFDLGYFSWTLFHEIQEGDGFFITRLKSCANGVIRKVRRGVRGPVRSIGRKMKECVFQTAVSDFDAEFGTGRSRIRLRVICLYNAKKDEEHWYVTNLPPKEFSAEEIAELYRLRWQIERLFMELKSDFGLDDLRSTREEVVLAWIYATLAALVLTRFLWTEAARLSHTSPDAFVPRLVTKIVRIHATLLAQAILARHACDLADALGRLILTISIHGLEPNPGRPGALRGRQWSGR